MKLLLQSAILAMSVGFAQADDGSTLYPYDGSFEDAIFSVESAILDQGLVIDLVSHTGDMLNRTGADVGSDIKLFESADIFLFCSAVLSSKVMEIDPMNIAHCPYSIFVIDRDGKVEVGYRHYPDGAMQEVQQFLDDIAQAAVSF